MPQTAYKLEQNFHATPDLPVSFVTCFDMTVVCHSHICCPSIYDICS